MVETWREAGWFDQQPVRLPHPPHHGILVDSPFGGKSTLSLPKWPTVAVDFRADSCPTTNCTRDTFATMPEFDSLATSTRPAPSWSLPPAKSWPSSPIRMVLLAIVAFAFALATTGCVPPPPPDRAIPITPAPNPTESAGGVATPGSPSEEASGETDAPQNWRKSKTTETDATSLRDKLDQALTYTLERRQLNTDDHAAWQILHGVLPYKLDFLVRIGRDGPSRSAVEYALEGGRIEGWTLEPGHVLELTGRPGLRAVLEAGTLRGQGHPDQWLAILAQCNLPSEQSLRVGQRTFTIGDLVAQCQHDLPYNVEQEYSWTLIGLSHYLPATAYWTAGDGETWNLERMVRIELDQSLDDSACGGTHRMIGLATALKASRAAGAPSTPTWREAEYQIGRAVELTLAYQNPDGSLSSQYFRRPSFSSDLANTLGTTGHLLEFLAVAMDDDSLRDPRVARAANALCDLFETTKDEALECGALYHAAHGLKLYRDRMYGGGE